MGFLIGLIGSVLHYLTFHFQHWALFPAPFHKTLHFLKVTITVPPYRQWSKPFVTSVFRAKLTNLQENQVQSSVSLLGKQFPSQK